MPDTTSSDHTLLLDWRRAGDPAAFAVLVQRHAAMVYSASMRVVRNRALAQEISQDTFLKLMQLDRFEGNSLGGWLHRVTTHRALDVIKSDARRHIRETDFADSRPSASVPAEVQILLDEIDAAIAGLPVELREPVVLHYLENRTHDDIGRALGLSRTAVGRRIQRGLDELRSALGARGVAALPAGLLIGLEATKTTAAPEALLASLRKLGLSVTPNASIPTPVRISASKLALAGVAALIILASVILLPRWAGARSDTSATSAPGTTAPLPAPVATLLPTPAETPKAEVPPVQLAAQVEQAPAPQEAPKTMVLRCLDTQGQPVPGAEVYIVRGERTASSLFATKAEDVHRQVFGPFESDAEGRVTVPAIEGKPDSTDVFGQGFAHVSGKWVGCWFIHPGFPKRENWDVISLVPSQTLTGRVTVPKGSDVQSVTVRLLTIYTGDIRRGGAGFGNASKFETETIPPLAAQHPDADGDFTFHDIPTNGSYYLSATATALAQADAFSGDPAHASSVKIEMKPESQLFGTLRYAASGAPADGVPVFARPRGGPTSRISVTTPFVTHTDNTGAFRFTGLPADVYSVMTPPKNEWVATVQTGIRVEEASKQGPVSLALEHGGIVQGSVRDAKKKTPIANVDLCALNPEDPTWNETLAIVSTDEAGHYQMRLPSGTSRIYFMKVPAAYKYPDDQGMKHATLKPDQQTPLNLDFTLETGEPYKDPGTALVIGRVLNPAGKPQADVPVFDDSVTGPRGIDMTRGLVGRTGADGKYSVKIRALGTHTFFIGGSNGFSRGTDINRFSVVKMRKLEPKKDETYDLGECTVQEYTESIGGTILDDAGDPVPRVVVGLRADIPGFPELGYITDATGTFMFKYVPKGQFKLWASPDMLTRPGTEAPSPFDTTQAEVESGFDYQIVLKRKPAGEPAHKP